MKLNVRVSWAAGMWINSTAEIILHLAANLWYEVITDIEYESRIKWWTNYYDILISNSWKCISKFVNILIAFDNKAVEKNINALIKNWIIIINKKYLEKFSHETKNIILNNNIKILDLEINEKYDNIYLLWIFWKLLDIPLELINKELNIIFAKKWKEIINKNIIIVENIILTYDISIEYNLNLQKIWESKITTFWNKAIADWATEWWLEFYSAYPMTPASTILSEIINAKKIKYLQAEDEIAVINAALWASFTWARTMVWSSGWGFALMTEALSFAIQAELPITVVLSQRAWPSTGTPTYFEQWDINFALNPTFGDFDHVVLCPSSIDEAYYYSALALNIADKYQTIALILIDKQLSEAFSTVDKELIVPEIDRWIILKNPPEDYKRYELNESWISKRVIVWTKNWDFISTSYEHDEYGTTTESSEMKMKMTEKRFKKLENFFEKENISWYEIINKNANKIIITFWVTSYTTKEFIKINPEFGLIIIKIFKPFDERLLKEIKDKKEIIFVESNYSGQLENYITKELWLKYIKWLKISHLRKYDLFPFYIEDFEELK